MSPKAIEKYDVANWAAIGNPSNPEILWEWASGDKIVLERYDDYWRGKPLLDGIIFKISPDDSQPV
jgi:ABC-type transport system substrate-binding protein